MAVKIEQWVFSPHAVQRKISVEEITELLKNPDDIQQQGPKYILSKRFSKRKDNNIAAVVIEKTGENLWVVITVMVNFQKK